MKAEEEAKRLARVRRHLYISGRVQGVFFRDETRSLAGTLNVTGWVRNLPDGRVEAVLEGEEEKVDRLVQWCRGGPRMATVDHVEVLEEPYQGGFDGFAITRSPL